MEPSGAGGAVAGGGVAGATGGGGRVPGPGCGGACRCSRLSPAPACSWCTSITGAAAARERRRRRARCWKRAPTTRRPWTMRQTGPRSAGTPPRGNLAEARRLFEHAIALGPDSRNFYRARRAKTGLGFVLWQQGDPAAAQSLLDERIAIRSKEDEEGLNAWGPAYELAAIHAVLGRRPEALTWLRRAVERGWREAHLAEIDVMLQTLSGDPEYERILRDVRRQVAQMKVRAGRIGLPQ